MKPYNEKKYFIMSHMVKDIEIESEIPFDIDYAIKEYANTLSNDYGISISKNAIKNKEPYYDCDGHFLGYWLTGKTGFEDRHTNTPYTEQYIDICVRIYMPYHIEECPCLNRGD